MLVFYGVFCSVGSRGRQDWPGWSWHEQWFGLE